MPQGTVSQSVSGGGSSIQKSFVRTGNTALALEVSLPVGEAGSLTTRSTDTTGTITMTSGSHSITTAAIVDVYWSGGVQYEVTVGTVSGTSVPISGGNGDVLPAQDTAVVVTEQVETNIALDGDNASLVAVSLEAASGSDAGHVDFQDSGDASIAELDLTANVPMIYDLDAGIANPFTGNPITHCQASNGSTTVAGTLKIIAVIDN